MENKTQEQVLHVDLTATSRKKVIVNNDENAVLYINTSDFGIYDRLKKGLDMLFTTLTNIQAKIKEVAESESANDSESENDGGIIPDAMADAMRDADAEMRGAVDFIFNYPVSDVCAPDGYMFDTFEGQLRFEYIISALTRLYENNINEEFYKLKSRIDAKLPSYVKGKK